MPDLCEVAYAARTNICCSVSGVRFCPSGWRRIGKEFEGFSVDVCSQKNDDKEKANDRATRERCHAAIPPEQYAMPSKLFLYLTLCVHLRPTN